VGGGEGSRLRFIYYPGFGTGMRKIIVNEANSAPKGWGEAWKDLENEFVEMVKGASASDNDLTEKIKQSSTYLINLQEKPEVADIKAKKETPICKKDGSI